MDMKRLIAAWLIAALCVAMMGCAALAEGETELSLELAPEEPALSQPEAPEAQALELDLAPDALEVTEPEPEAPAEAAEGLQSNAAAPNNIVLSKLISYEIVGGEATVVSADRAITDANIPAAVKGYPVTAIADGAFAGCKKLWTVTVPDTVTEIGKDAFSGCAALVNVELTENLEKIGNYAFKDCIKLSHFDLPEGLTVIGEGLFENCEILWKIAIPSTIKKIEDGAFYKCLSLKEFTLPEGLTEMGQSAFELCEAMKKVTIPASLTAIPECAFRGCGDLRQVTLQKGLKTIDKSAFYGCDSLTTLKLPDTVQSVGRLAFAYCEDLKKLTIPDSLSTVSYGAFFHCSDLEEVCVEDGVEALDDYSFAQCKKLVKVELPESVTSFGEEVFTLGKSSRVDEDGDVQLNKPLKLPKKLKLYGRSGCKAQSYAKANGIPYVVQKKVATSVTIAEGSSATLYMGETLQLTAVQKPADAETTLKWSSSSSSIVKVSKKGLLTPKKAGKATVTVKTENGRKDTIAIKVVDAKSVSIDEGKTLTMKVGEKLPLHATVLPSEVTTKLSWSSDKKKVATVSKSGTVTAKKKGKATITVKTANGKRAKVKIVVTD